MKRLVANLLAILPVLGLMGCLSQSSLDGFALSPQYARTPAVFFVEKLAADQRGLDGIIVDELRRAGLDAVTNEPQHYDYLVTYEDHWYWDMRNYLIDMRIDVRDARTNVLVATGRSFQTSLSAMGETPESIIHKVVDVLIHGPER